MEGTEGREHLEGDLSILAPDEWFNKPKNSSILVRIYTSVGIDPDEFDSVMEKFVDDVGGSFFEIQEEKILFAHGGAEGMEVPRVDVLVGAHDGHSFGMYVFVGSPVELPRGNYVFLTSPLETDGKTRAESEVKKALDRIVGIMRLYAGHNFLHDLAFEGKVNASTGEFSKPSRSVQTPRSSHGPFLSSDIGSGVSDIIDALKRARRERWNRLSLALEYINEGVRKENGFFEYWTALEILCGSSDASGAIPAKLARCYDRDPNEIRKDTAFAHLENWRHDFIHSGVRPSMTPDVERYIQILILDVLRHELDLSHEGHLGAYEQTEGVDLTPLGLSDNRTKEQKKQEQKARKEDDSDRRG